MQFQIKQPGNSSLRGGHWSEDLREKHRLAGKNGGLDQESSSRGSEEKTDSFFFFFFSKWKWDLAVLSRLVLTSAL